MEHERDAAANFEFAYGSVKITSDPLGAGVARNGKEIGQTPLLIEEVKPGEVAYELRMEGFKPVVLTGTVVTNEQTFLAGRLEQNRGPERGKPWRNTLGMKFVPVNDSVLFCIWQHGGITTRSARRRGGRTTNPISSRRRTTRR